MKKPERVYSLKSFPTGKWHFPLSLHLVYVPNGFLRWEMRAATAEGAACLPNMVSLITVWSSHTQG